MTNQKKKPGLLAHMEDLQEQMAPMMGTHYFSKMGVRISPQWWSSLYQDKSYRRVATESVLTKIDGKTEMFMVYADWHGVDDREVKIGPPLIFEIKVKTPFDAWSWKAHTPELAQTIHAVIVAKLKEGVAPCSLVVENPYN